MHCTRLPLVQYGRTDLMAIELYLQNVPIVFECHMQPNRVANFD